MEMVSRERAGQGQVTGPLGPALLLWLAGDYLSMTGNHLVDSSKRTADHIYLLATFTIL